MRTAICGVVVLVLGATEAWAQACSNRVFCSGWRAVCHRTLPRGGDPKVCTQRFAECLSSGCYFFDRPGPRCKNNPADLALTTSCQRGR